MLLGEAGLEDQDAPADAASVGQQRDDNPLRTLRADLKTLICALWGALHRRHLFSPGDFLCFDVLKILDEGTTGTSSLRGLR